MDENAGQIGIFSLGASAGQPCQLRHAVGQVGTGCLTEPHRIGDLHNPSTHLRTGRFEEKAQALAVIPVFSG
jgi:hypothetical protein